jgi:hypothetical protein
MAIKANTSILYDGIRNAVVQLTGISDGVDNENNVVKVDVSQLGLSPQNRPCVKVSVLEIAFNVSRGQVTLAWDALDPVPFENLEGNRTIKYWFSSGLHNDFMQANGATGNIVLSTSNVEPGSTYTIMLQLKKKYQ